MSPAFVEFCKKVGIVGGAITVVIFLANLTGGFALSVAARPIMDEIKAERLARVEADEKLAERLERMNSDRLELVDFMLTPAGPARARKLAELREQWAR
jgi:hypothetical protein